MIMSQITTYKGVSTGDTEEILGRDVSNLIWHNDDPTNLVLTTLTGGMVYEKPDSQAKEVKGIIGKLACEQTKYEVIEKDALGRTWTVNGAVASTTEQTVVFASTTGLQKGMLLREKSSTSPEYISIQTVTNTTDVEAARNVSATAYQIPDGAVFVCVGYAQKDGGSKRALRAQVATNRKRYLQNFRNPWGITEQFDQVKQLVSTSAWTEEMKQAQQQHQYDKEFSCWMNPNADSTTDADGNTVNLSRGFLAELTATGNTVDCQGAMTTQKLLGEVSQECFEHGGKKLLVADGKFLNRISEDPITRQLLKPGDNSFGLAINELVTIHGTWMIIHTGIFGTFFAESEYGMAVSVDPDYIKYRYLNNMDTRYKEGIETPGDQVREADFRATVGWSFLALNRHKWIKNIG
jgi:hypothetical protein